MPSPVTGQGHGGAAKLLRVVKATHPHQNDVQTLQVHAHHPPGAGRDGSMATECCERRAALRPGTLLQLMGAATFGSPYLPQEAVVLQGERGVALLHQIMYLLAHHVSVVGLVGQDAAEHRESHAARAPCHRHAYVGEADAGLTTYDR